MPSLEPYQQLEIEWAKFNDLDPAGMVACASGTAALHLSLEAFQLPLGSEVICPDFTMIACPRAITLAGLTPVFVDCDERLLMDQVLVHNVFLLEAKAVLAVHIYGRQQDMTRLGRYASIQNWMIIEDLAEAHGVRPHSHTDAACWSFFKNKIVAGEEGGAVWFRDPGHAKLARQLRCLGFTEAHDFMHVPRGINARMSNAHAELILKSLCYYSPFETWAPHRRHLGNLGWRREIESWYDELCPAEWKMPPRDAPWVFDLKLPEGIVRQGWAFYPDYVVHALRKSGIAARGGFKPMHMQEEYRGGKCRLVTNHDDLPTSTKMAMRVLYLPIQPGITTKADAARAFEIIRSALS